MTHTEREARSTPGAPKLLRQIDTAARSDIGVSPVLATIPKDLVETFHYLVSRLQFDNAVGLASRVAVVAGSHGEGVTTVARTLASVLANDLDARVCLLDVSGQPLSARSPESGKIGLLNVLADDAPLASALQPTADPRLQLLVTGATDSSSLGQVARSPRMADVLDELDLMFDFVVLDVPPVLVGSEGIALLRHVLSYIMVVKHGSTPTAQVRDTATELRSLECLGVVLNQFSSRIPKGLRRFFRP
jgi:Mrp family chromosome partitioning ATPase